MGKGNVGVAGAYEGLFYIDNEDFHVYRRNDDLDDWPETRPDEEIWTTPS